MFWINGGSAGAHLRTDAALTPAEFQLVADRLGRSPLRVRKIGYVAAREAVSSEVVQTRWNGLETTNTARPGDFVVTNLSPLREPLRDSEGCTNVYVIEASRFADLYEPTGGSTAQGAVFRAKSIVPAIPLPGGFDIMAPWGERQTGADGYLLCNGADVYGVIREAFEATYEVMV